MDNTAAHSSCQMLSFNSPVDGHNKDKKMKRFKPKYNNNFDIQTISKTEYKIHVRVKVNGKPIPKVETFHGTKTEAKRRAPIFVDEVRRSAENASSPSSLTFFSTFDECVEYYKEYKNIGSKDITYIKQIKDELGDANIEDLNQRLNQFINWKKTQLTKYGKPYSNGTLNHYRKWTRAVINFCIENEKLPNDKTILRKQKLLKELPRTRIISDDEIERLLSSIDVIAPHLYPALLFSLQIPIRRGAIINMESGWVNGNIITIPAQYTKHKQHDDPIPIPPNMIEYFSSLPNFKYVFFKELKRNKYRKLSDNDFSRLWSRVKKDANVADLRWHDSRHHACTSLLLSGISERVVMQVGGWKTNMFNTYYNHSSISACEEVFSHLNQK